MREIKFKAYLKKHKETVFVDFIDFFEKEIIVIDGYGNEYCFDFNEIELMQYTGLKDKSGKEIYQGDIGWDEYYECYGVVKFDEGKFVYEWENICEDLFEMHNSIKIIGNIYEDKHLLESE